MSRPIIEYYEKIEQVSQKMLRAAKNSAWDELYAHEENCKILINELRETARHTELTKMQRQKRLPSCFKYSKMMPKFEF